MNKNLLLACESSCDETSFCIYDIQNKKVICHSTYSQIETHMQYGGVTPELASQKHLEVIDPLLHSLLSKYNILLNEISYFASTTGPGLPGSLLIGSSYTKALAWHFQKPFIPVNHLAGHIYSTCIEHEVRYPHICLSVSGGHTALYLVKSKVNFTQLSSTKDDAAGELFDKVSKLLGEGYPGGAKIENLASSVDFKDIFKFPRLKKQDISFSFSGLKTAVLYQLVKDGYYSLENKKLISKVPEDYKKAVASSLLCAVNDILIDRLKRAFSMYTNIHAITFVGGVACNKFIKNNIALLAKSLGINSYSPSPEYCTDNAAMIAQSALHIIESKKEILTNYTADIWQS